MLEYDNCGTSFWKDSLDNCFTYAQDMISEEEPYDDVDENNDQHLENCIKTSTLSFYSATFHSPRGR